VLQHRLDLYFSFGLLAEAVLLQLGFVHLLDGHHVTGVLLARQIDHPEFPTPQLLNLLEVVDMPVVLRCSVIIIRGAQYRAGGTV